MDTLQSVGTFFARHFRRWKSWLFQSLLFSGYFAFIELFFHITEELEFTSRFIYPILFALPVGFLFSAIFSLFETKINCILSTVIAGFFGVWFLTQIIYSSVFMTYMEFNKISMGGDVAKDFGTEMVDAIIANIPKIIAVALITAVFSLVLFLYLRPKKQTIVVSGASLILCLLLHLFARGMLYIGEEGAFSPANMYVQHPRILDNNIENFGVMTSLRLELYDLLFYHPSDNGPSFESIDNDILNPGGDDTDPPYIHPDVTQDPNDTNFPDDSDQTGPVPPPEPVKLKNTIDINLDAMIAQESNKNLLAIHNYVKSQQGTYTNQYTGMFEGYNLIMICAESFTDHMIDPELTPTLYKLSTNGFVFNNFYGMFKSITTNGEYAFCTGLIPNTVGKTDDLKKNSTFLLSADKYLPYCMGNVFNDFGAFSAAYHNNTGSYYRRELTHPNMGYQLVRFMDGAYENGVFDTSRKLTFSTGKKKPNSDEEVAVQTLDDYLSNKDENGNVKQFTAYYMTYSGHHPYYGIDDKDHTKSPMAFVNRERVDNLDVSERLKTYLACNLEVEDMLTVIMKRLEEEGCLENTVIVLTNDHYPYGLYDSEYRKLAGKSVDAAFGIYENAFICYNAGMEKPIEIDTPCCTVDIIPTLLNLFGYDYDSRLLAGVDVLDIRTFHVAMLYNKSFVTDKIKFNASKNKVTYLVDKSTVSDAYVQACISYVQNKFEMSLQIIENDYYKVFYDNLAKQQAAS